METSAQKQIGISFFNDCEKNNQTWLVKEIGKFYDRETVLLKPTPLPQYAYYPLRDRYRAEKILDVLPNSQGMAILTITNKDISTSNHGVYDWGMVGLASFEKRVCVMSTYRLDANKNKILNAALHELGHSLQLQHCPNNKCLIQDFQGKIPYSLLNAPNICDDCYVKVML